MGDITELGDLRGPLQYTYEGHCDGKVDLGCLDYDIFRILEERYLGHT